MRCPAGCDIQTYLAQIACGDYAAAIATIKQTLALPAALGRICPHPCEEECRRQRVDEPVAICALKRFAADIDLNNQRPYRPPVEPDTGRRVAVIGAGPAGLSCAYYLRQRGHRVVIFDAQPEPGGMLRYGIPAFRLPREVLAAEIRRIAELGVEFRLGQRLGRDFTLEQLREEFDAVFLAIGAWRSSSLRVEGEDHPRVLGGIDFLERVAKGEEVRLGRRVMVIGGGNTAMDACRTAVRLDAEEVTVLYRRSRKEMPANPQEVEAALTEGVKIQFLAAPVRITPTDEALTVECVRMELGEPDASGRRRPVPIPGSNFTLEVDTLIAAIGQTVERETLADAGLELDRWNCIVADPATCRTSLEGVFAGGDCVTGPGIAVEAMAAGRRAAAAIDQFLRGQPVTGEPRQFTSLIEPLEAVPAERFAGVERAERVRIPEIEPARRLSFEEVERGLDEESARREAQRCLACGCAAREDCKLRTYASQYGADPERLAGERRSFERDDSHEKLAFELGKCINCGSCVRVCRDVKGLEVLSFAGRGFTARVRPIFGRPLAETPCDGCLKCVEVCPTGAVFAKTPQACTTPS